MFKNALNTALRAFVREQRYTFLNISGLVVGLTTAIFIFLWVVNELSWDRYHTDSEDIYVVMENQTYSSGVIETYEATPSPLAEKLKSDFEEVEESCRMTWPDHSNVTVTNKSVSQAGVYADPSLFSIFTLPLIEGNPAKLLSNPNSIVITRQLAEVLFGSQPALGKTLVVGENHPVVVTGVLDKLPRATTLDFDFVLPMEGYLRENADEHGWTHHNLFTYIKLSDSESDIAFSKKIKTLLATTNEPGDVIELFLFKFSDTHLYFNFEQGAQKGGRIVYVRTFAIVAVFILLTACINFMNLATARAARRAREVGIRKVTGASRKDLIGQFLTESLLLSFISLFIALVFVHLLTPLFNVVANTRLSMDYGNPTIVVGLLAITIATGLVAGSYPAFLLSSFRPTVVMRGNLYWQGKSSSFRNLLVILQFSLSITLVILALVVNQQMQYIEEKELGYDRRNVFVVPSLGINSMEKFRSDLLQFPFVRAVGQGVNIPPNIYTNDHARWSAMPEGETVTVQSTICDEDYIDALGLNLIEGRAFSREISSDSNAFIINESAAQALGIYTPIGQEITLFTMKGRIIGVVKDFHNRDLYSPIDPVVFVLDRAQPILPFAFVRYEPGKSAETRQAVTDVFKRGQPLLPVEMHDLEQYNTWSYRSEQLMGRLSVCFTVVVVFIALLGLFGLTSFITERRRKEIGVRKVLGASVEGLVAMFCVEFLRPLVLSFVIGFPLAFYLMYKFLDRFEYRIDPSVWIFVITGISMFIVSACTVGYQSASAALANPAETLRAE